MLIALAFADPEGPARWGLTQHTQTLGPDYAPAVRG
jgi:hypothetical protein